MSSSKKEIRKLSLMAWELRKRSCEFTRILHLKGFPCKQEKSCYGCTAFSPYINFSCNDEVESERAKGKWNTFNVEALWIMHHLGLCSACIYEFPQEWISVFEFSPMKPCPKEYGDAVDSEFKIFKRRASLNGAPNFGMDFLAGKISMDSVLESTRRILLGNFSKENVWDCINDLRETFELLKKDSQELIEKNNLEEKFICLDSILINLAQLFNIKKPKGFSLRKLNGFSAIYQF